MASSVTFLKSWKWCHRRGGERISKLEGGSKPPLFFYPPSFSKIPSTPSSDVRVTSRGVLVLGPLMMEEIIEELILCSLELLQSENRLKDRLKTHTLATISQIEIGKVTVYLGYTSFAPLLAWSCGQEEETKGGFCFFCFWFHHRIILGNTQWWIRLILSFSSIQENSFENQKSAQDDTRGAASLSVHDTVG